MEATVAVVEVRQAEAGAVEVQEVVRAEPSPEYAIASTFATSPMAAMAEVPGVAAADRSEVMVAMVAAADTTAFERTDLMAVHPGAAVADCPVLGER